MEDLWEHALTVLEDRDVSELHSFQDETGILVKPFFSTLPPPGRRGQKIGGIFFLEGGGVHRVPLLRALDAP